MKRSRGFSFLAIGVLVGAIGVEAAFWNRKSKEEEAPKVAEPTAPYAGVATEVSPPIRSLTPRTASSPAVLPAEAAGASSPLVQRRPHVQMQDQASVDALVQLAESRRLREQEIRVLARLHSEKEGELARMNERLLERFGIAADANYQYDNETRSLFLLLPKPGDAVAEGASPEDLFEKRLHRTFDAKGTEIEFVRLVSAKKITASELQVLKLLLKEKDLELTKVHGSLKERFAISPDKHYEFDATSRTLFEVIRPAGGVNGGNLGP